MSTTRQTHADVSVVLCAYTEERWDDLLRAVDSVDRQSMKAREIIIVIDNNARLLTRARHEILDATVLHNTGIRGAGQSRNIGVEAASGTIIAFLDDDARASPRWIEHALTAFEDTRTLGVGGRIDPDWEGAKPRWLASEFYWTVGCTYPGLPTTPEPVRNLIAANMFVRRDSFLALGGFRSGFGKTGARSGTEETELCIRGGQRWPDRVWLHHPNVAVSHRVPRSRSRPSYFISRCYDEGHAKASIVRFVGGHEGLASERAYTRRTLPKGIVRGVRATFRNADPSGVVRSLSILIGLGATVCGYIAGRIAGRRLRHPRDDRHLANA